MTDSANVQRINDRGICSITFFHPAHNSLPNYLLQDLASAITVAGHDLEVKIIILRSSGTKSFCAGASFDELLEIKNEAEGLQFFSGFATVINAMRMCPKIIVSRVQGKAIGGGVGLCAASDFCIANKWSTFRLSELAVGIGPFVIGPAVERKIGLSHFSRLALTPSEWQTADLGKQIGLYQEVFDEVEKMDDYLEFFVQNLLSYSAEALMALKQNFWIGTEHWDTLLIDKAKISGRLILTERARNAIQSFKNKA